MSGPTLQIAAPLFSGRKIKLKILTITIGFLAPLVPSAPRMPLFGQFGPNSTQTLIGPWNTIDKSVVVIGMYLGKIRKSVCFEHDVQEICCFIFWASFGLFLNAIDNFFSGGSTDASCKVWCKSLKLPRRNSKKHVFQVL